jgi:hypothetical protein
MSGKNDSGPSALDILHPNSRIITAAGIRRLKMYAGVIASAVHDALRRGLAIAVMRGPTNRLRTAHEGGYYFGNVTQSGTIESIRGSKNASWLWRTRSAAINSR